MIRSTLPSCGLLLARDALEESKSSSHYGRRAREETKTEKRGMDTDREQDDRKQPHKGETDRDD